MKIFIVSLPCTGVTNLCDMIRNMGYVINDDMSHKIKRLLKTKVDVFADPTVCLPSTFIKFISPKHKFIYINVPFDDWYAELISRKILYKYNNLLHDGIKPDGVLYETLTVLFDGKVINKDRALEVFTKHQADVMHNLPMDDVIYHNTVDGLSDIIDFLR